MNGRIWLISLKRLQSHICGALFFSWLHFTHWQSWRDVDYFICSMWSKFGFDRWIGWFDFGGIYEKKKVVFVNLWKRFDAMITSSSDKIKFFIQDMQIWAPYHFHYFSFNRIHLHIMNNQFKHHSICNVTNVETIMKFFPHREFPSIKITLCSVIFVIFFCSCNNFVIINFCEWKPVKSLIKIIIFKFNDFFSATFAN